MRSGEIVRRAHISRSVLRYYEKIGILPHAVRNSSGYRDYGASDLARVQLITGARHLGCSFREIKALLDVQTANKIPSEDILELLARSAVEVDEEMKRLRQVQIELSRLREVALALAEGEPEHDELSLTATA